MLRKGLDSRNKFEGKIEFQKHEPERNLAVAEREHVRPCFRVSGFGFRVLGFGLRVLGLRSRVLSSGFGVEG